MLYPEDFGEFVFLKLSAGEFLVFLDHIPDPFLIESDAGVFGNPGSIQNVDEFVRQFFPEHIVKAPDAVAAGGENNTFVIFCQHIFQDTLCETADIGMHFHICLCEIGD